MVVPVWYILFISGYWTSTILQCFRQILIMIFLLSKFSNFYNELLYGYSRMFYIQKYTYSSIFWKGFVQYWTLLLVQIVSQMGFQSVILFNGIFIFSSWLLWYGPSCMLCIQLYTFSIFWNVLYQKNYILSSNDISNRFSILTSFSVEYL